MLESVSKQLHLSTPEPLLETMLRVAHYQRAVLRVSGERIQDHLSKRMQHAERPRRLIHQVGIGVQEPGHFGEDLANAAETGSCD